MAPSSKGIKGSKRVQVDKDKTIIFVIVAIAAVISVGSLMVSKGLWSQANYLDKVSGKKEVAVKQLEDNKKAVDSLKESYDTFRNQNPNLIGGSPDGQGDREGDNAKLILDSLPSRYDFPALTSSLEQLLFGYKINGITGTDDAIIQQENTTEAVVDIPLSIDVATSYEGFKTLIDNLDKSIRPFHILQLELRGSNTTLQTTVSMKTFYQPEKGLEITEEQVP